MRTTHKIALVFALSLAGAGTIAWYRGRTGKEILTDALLHGTIVGTGLGVAIWLSSLNETRSLPNYTQSIPSLGLVDRALSLMNGAKAMGNMSQEAVKLLSQIDYDRLYAPLHDSIRVGEVPEDPSMVELK